MFSKNSIKTVFIKDLTEFAKQNIQIEGLNEQVNAARKLANVLKDAKGVVLTEAEMHALKDHPLTLIVEKIKSENLFPDDLEMRSNLYHALMNYQKNWKGVSANELPNDVSAAKKLAGFLREYSLDNFTKEERNALCNRETDLGKMLLKYEAILPEKVKKQLPKDFFTVGEQNKFKPHRNR